MWLFLYISARNFNAQFIFGLSSAGVTIETMTANGTKLVSTGNDSHFYSAVVQSHKNTSSKNRHKKNSTLTLFGD